MAKTFFTPKATVPGDIDFRTDILSTWIEMSKGYTAPPLTVSSDPESGDVTIKFTPGDFVKICSGSIQCLANSLAVYDADTQLGTFCASDTEFLVTLSSQQFSENEPLVYSFTFEDAAGNETSVTGFVILGIVPMRPIALVETGSSGRKNILIGILPFTQSTYDLRDIADQFQVQRYIRNESNAHTFIDWSDLSSGGLQARNPAERIHLDRDIIQGVQYGYRVRFRTSEDDVSEWSAWTTVSTS